MTDTVLTTSINETVGDAFIMNAGDSLVVSAGITASTTDGAASGILAKPPGVGVNMTIMGAVSGYYGIESQLASTTIIISQTGSATGSLGGISISGDAIIRNFGIISGLSGISCTTTTTNLLVYNEGLISAPAGTAIAGSVGNDTIINNGTIDGAIFLGSGDDTYFGRGGLALTHIPGFSSLVQLGEGNDWAYGGSGSELFFGDVGNDFLDGGDGIDTASFNGTGFAVAMSVDLRRTDAQNTGEGFDTLVNIENVTTTAGADTLTGNGQNNVLSSGAGQDVLDGGAGNDTLIGGAGNDLLDGGSGQNTAVFAGAESNYEYTANANGTFTVKDKRDALTNQDGTDQLTNIRFLHFGDGHIVALTNAAPSAIALSTSAVAENALTGTIVASLSSLDPDGDAIAFSLVSNPEGLFRLDGSNLVLMKNLDFETHAQHTITVMVTDAYGEKTTTVLTLGVTNVVETTALTLTGTLGADSLTSEAGNDLLFGLDGNDVLRGEAGNDKLFGWLGLDGLYGGTGQDIFVFDSKPNAKTNLDRIYDFSVPDDTLHLAKSAFTKIAKKGVLAKTAFWTGDKAHDATDRIIYNKKTGAVFYDADGTGSSKAVQFASLSKNLKMTEKDFFII